VTEIEHKPTFGEAVDLLLKTLKAFDEKQQRTLIKTVCDLLELQIVGGREERPALPTSGGTSPPPPPALDGNEKKPEISATDIRSLRELKKPKSATQMAALVAYYLQELAPEGERRNAVKTENLEPYFKQARFDLPERLSQVLPDSKKAGYLEVVSRGEYKLTRVGYNLVAHRMPEA